MNLAHRPLPRALARLLSFALLVASSLFFVRPVHAAGSVKLSTRTPDEVNEKWKLNMTINYGSTPPLAHIPMLFIFTPKVLYERALTDQSPEKPIINKIPLQNQQSINESMDVGFSDASGKIFNITKFDFVIRRDHGFEAGEYDLQIKRSDDNVQIGPTIKLTLKGENPIVDRRAIVFAGAKKSKKTEKKDDEPKGDEAKGDEPKGDEAAPSAPTADEPEPGEGPEVPAVPPKQGGCGCVVAGDSGSAPAPLGALAFAVLGLSAAFARRSLSRR